jgi:hypothetical protein
MKDSPDVEGAMEGGHSTGWEIGDYCKHPGRRTRVLVVGGWIEMPTLIDYDCIQIERSREFTKARIRAFALACKGAPDPMKPLRDVEREYGKERA